MEKFGVQLYSFTRDCDLDFLERIKVAGEIGYSYVEFAGGYDELPVETVKKALADAGVTASSAHVRVENMEKDLPYLAELGVKYIIAPSAPFCNKEEAKELADELNAFGEKCAPYGIKTGFHNHRSEFTMDGDKAIIEWLIEYTNPETVVIELDCGWCTAAGWNAAEFITKHAGRVAAVHIKENAGVLGVDEPSSRKNPKPRPAFELDENGKPILPPEFLAMLKAHEDVNVAQGKGNVDWQAVKAAADAQYDGVIYVVERESSYNESKDRVACLKEDAQWIKANL
ncbi:MAG: sugar phosphate isomerase/epimerase [Clostridia bacterium]